MQEVCSFLKFANPKPKGFESVPVSACNYKEGLFTLDAPADLIQKVMTKAKEHKFDAIIMNGDFVGHGVAADTEELLEQQFPKEKEYTT
jgi:hypothetical protein